MFAIRRSLPLAVRLARPSFRTTTTVAATSAGAPPQYDPIA